MSNTAIINDQIMTLSVHWLVELEGIDLTLLDTAKADQSIDIAENNFDFVGIPVFVCRSFRHRCFFVRKGSDIQSFKDLEGKRVGTDFFPASGNTWSRAALREQGVALDKIQWWEGSIDESYAPIEKPSEISPFSPNQELKTLSERKLETMLIEGELDALMCPFPPERFYDDNSQIVRLLADFKSEEQAYYRRTGVNPAHHIMGLRRSVLSKTLPLQNACIQHSINPWRSGWSVVFTWLKPVHGCKGILRNRWLYWDATGNPTGSKPIRR